MNEPNGTNSKICDCAAGCAYQESGIGRGDPTGESERICRVVEELRLLFNVSKTLQESPSLGEIVAPVLRQMAESLGLYRGAVRILNRETREIVIDEAFGLSAEEMAASRIQLGEGVIGQVAKTGKPVIIPDLEEAGQSVHPDCAGFSGQTIQRPGATAFLCVPIIHGSDVMGTLSGYRRGGEPHALEADQRLLVVTAQLIAQAARLRQTSRENLDALRLENERLQEQIRKHFKPDNMIGNSRAMQIVYNSIEQVAASNTTVLIRGESGVGKELVAHAIHMRSSRALKPLVKVNCAALPESIVESELFGHERGAFTGAIAMRKGRFELAHGGTIFLDEIGELPLSVQAKLLRILQEREFERVGGTSTLRCDVRVIAATNRSLEDYMQAEKFRLDLYYRLNVFPIYVPALRERKADMLALADFFVEKYSEAIRKPVMRISTPAIDMLMSYHWPGNVRELENCIERAVLLSTDGVSRNIEELTVEEDPQRFRSDFVDKKKRLEDSGFTFSDYNGMMSEMKKNTLVIDDISHHEIEQLIKLWKPDIIGSGIKDKFVIEKMGIPCKQLHSYDYGGPYAVFTGAANFYREVDRMLQTKVWQFVVPPWQKNPDAQKPCYAPRKDKREKENEAWKKTAEAAEAV